MSCNDNPSCSKSLKIHEPKAKKFTRIPIFVAENHNDVCEIILPCLANLYLPFQNNLMIHFDAHPDLCISSQMPAETVYQRSLLLESLSIENWIMPMVYAGHFNDVVWVRPSFATQIPDDDYEIIIGDCDGKICVNSPLDYFLTDGSYKQESILRNKKSLKLKVTQIDASLNEHLMNASNENRPWILDIDLDFFSTLNPFLSIYPKANTYEKLKEIFKIDKNYDVDNLDSIQKFVDERNRQISFFDTIFQYMAQNGSLENFESVDESMKDKFELTKQLIECLCHNYSIYDIDWFVVNDAGCTTDEEKYQLPNHESSDEEIKEMMKVFEKFLKDIKSPPVIITISRSSNDGYTPTHQVDMIQELVVQTLRNAFGETLADQPTLWYKKPTAISSALELVELRIKRK